MTGFPINPPRTQMVDANGNVQPEWYRFFVQIQQRIGGVSDPFVDASLMAAPPLQHGAGSGDDFILPPTVSAPPSDPLVPPVHMPRVDDLMYPPPIRS